MSAASFCTCTDFKCPLHPTNHDKGCDPCISKNLRKDEIPTCFFNKVKGEDKISDFTVKGFANLVISKFKSHS